jgi:hypothetical protein
MLGNNPVLFGAACIAGLCAICFLLGFAIGRIGERRAICKWLWERPAPFPSWGDIRAVEDGAHRRHGVDSVLK